MITKTDLKKIDVVDLTKALLAFNNVVRREIIDKEDKKCIETTTKTLAERK